MLLSRNTNNNNGVSWLIIPVLLCILAVAIFGARDLIKEELRKFIAPNRAEIENIIQEFIEKNPKVMIHSLQEMQKREHEEMTKQAQLKIHNKKEELQGNNSEINSFAGNKDGDVVVITFLDYRCGYCKHGNNSLKALIKQDANVKVIFKELPILGPPSQKLAQTALAVYLLDPSKYIDFHNALMDSRETDDKFIEATLQKLGLDKVKVEELMKDARVAKELN
jgi:protein-disulfide isomerase